MLGKHNMQQQPDVYIIMILLFIYKALTPDAKQKVCVAVSSKQSGMIN